MRYTHSQRCMSTISHKERGHETPEASPQMLDDSGAAGVVEGEVTGSAEQAVVADAQHATELAHTVGRRFVLGGVGRGARPHCLHLPPRV